MTNQPETGRRPGNPGDGRASLFLIELMVTTVLFAFSGIICAGLFASAHRKEVQAADLTRAVRAAENAAECYLASDGDPAETERLLSLCFPGAPKPLFAEALPAPESGAYLERCIYFNSAWDPVPDGAEAAYLTGLRFFREAEEPPSMDRLEISVRKAGNGAGDGRATGTPEELFQLFPEELFSLEVSNYRQKGGRP